MPRGQQLTPETVQQITVLTEQGKSNKEIAAQTGVPYNTVWHHAVHALTPKKADVLRQLIMAGRTMELDEFKLSVVGNPAELTKVLYGLRSAGYVKFGEINGSHAGKRSGISHHIGIRRVEATSKGHTLFKTTEPHAGTAIRSMNRVPDAVEVMGRIVEFRETDREIADVADSIRRDVSTEPLPGEPKGNAYQARALRHPVDPEGELIHVDDLNGVPSRAPGGPIERIAPEPLPIALREAPAPTIVEEIFGPYPLLDALLDKTSLIEQAVKLLDKAGLADHAIAALEAIRYTALEAEYIAYAKEHR